MVTNRNEPATKFFGPNHRFIKSISPSKVIVQLHNLQPGEFWKPPLTPLIQSKRILNPILGRQSWIAGAFPFAWLWTYSPTTIRLQAINQVSQSTAFIINLRFAETRWMLNELTDPDGNYAFGGTATLSWKDAG